MTPLLLLPLAKITIAIVLSVAFTTTSQAQPLPKPEVISTRAADLLAQSPNNESALDDDENVDLLAEFTITGSQVRRPRSETTTPVYVIDRAEIEQKGARTLGDVIRNTPGVTSNISGAGSDVHNGYFIRGLPTTSTAILVDGRPITNLNQEHYDPGEISIFEAERVEVMPSGGTTLYGSTALGGVINVITRQPTKPAEVVASTEFGSYGYSKYSASYRGKSGSWLYSLSTENFNTLNNFPYEVERPTGTLRGIRPGGDVNSRSYQGKLGYELDSRNTLTLSGILQNSYKGISPVSIIDDRQNVYNGLSADQLGLNDDHKSRLNTDSYGLALTWDSKLGKGDDSQLQTRISLDRALNREVAAGGEDFRTEIYLLGIRSSHSWQLNPNWRITYGFDYLKEMGRSEVLSSNELDYDTSLERPALFVLNDVKLTSNLFLSAGGRYSLTDKYGNSLDPNLGLRWQMTPTFALRTNFNRGFKAPNFHDLFGKTVHKGNPNLLPERGSFWDAGVDWQPSPKTNLGVTGFISDVRNLASLSLVDPRQPDFAEFTALGYVNGDRVRVNYPSVYNSGFEMSFDWQLSPNWKFFLTETYTDARIINSGRPEIDQTQYALVPFHMGRVGFSYEEPIGFRAALFTNFVGQRSVDTYHVGPADVEVDPGIFISQVAKLPTGSTIPGYMTLDLSLRFPLASGLILNAYIDNLLNTYYERSYGGPAPGTNFRVGLTSTF